MCSPLSASEWVMRCAASLTCWPTRSLIVERSCVRSMCTLLIAERTCSAWPTSVSRWLARSCKQAANADFVVAVGALERGDFVLHQRFELAGARQRALDAVAHGRDFAADRLADGDDGIARHAFGLGKPHGDPRHRLRDQAQFLRAPRHVGDAEEEDDRQQSRGAETDHQRDRRMVGTKRGIDVGKIGPGQREAADNPGAGKHGGDEIGRTRRPALQRLQDLADRLLIVIGGAAAAAGDRAMPRVGRRDRLSTGAAAALGRRCRRNRLQAGFRLLLVLED